MDPTVAKFMPYIVTTVMLLMVVLLHRKVLQLFGVILIPQDALAIVNRKFVVAGRSRTLPDGAIIALNNEAGYQADTLAPGVHYGFWPWQYEITQVKFFTVPEGKIGVVEARDGVPLPPGRVLAKHVDCNSYQNARMFLEGGGERGAQVSVIPPGTYRINTALFSISLASQLEVPDDQVGVVTVKEGRPLNTASGDIAGIVVEGHNSFQNGQAFLSAGGFKGLQEQVILAGRYFINPLFADVEMKPMTVVKIAEVGVVVSYVGPHGEDVSGADFTHGNIVKRGQKGVWSEPLDPGKYPVNPYTHKVEMVPTANIVLNWASNKSEAHKLDEKLSTIKVRSMDGYAFSLDVAQIINILAKDAPLVIARFGTVINMISQVLEPTIGNYFRISAQRSDAIDFLRNRDVRQQDAKDKIAAVLKGYNVGGVDTLIGDIVPPEELMKTLTDRKLAEQQNITFETQRQAEETRKALEQAKATAATQAGVVKAERDVEIARFNANAAAETAEGSRRATVTAAEGAKQAAILKAEGESASLAARAQGEASRIEAEAKATASAKTQIGKAEAAAIQATGEAEASVIKLKIASMDPANFASVEIARALAASHLKLVPEIYVGSNGDGSNGLASAFMAQMMRKSGGGLTETELMPAPKSVNAK